jgi:hypothetical protein
MPEGLKTNNPAKTVLEKRPFIPQFNARDLSATRDGVCVPPCTMPNTIRSLKAR